MVTANKILDAAETRMRRGGYNAVSFRDVAADTGIKSASVHYHFPKKEDLALALVTRYADRFFEALEAEAVSSTKPFDRVTVFCNAYRAALKAENTICLCGMLGAESLDLPPAVIDAVGKFFDANIAWIRDSLNPALSPNERRKFATNTVASLQGAMILATTLEQPELFEGVVDTILDGVIE